MDWMLLLLMIPFVALCWWAGFFATKRYRLAKNIENDAKKQQSQSRDD